MAENKTRTITLTGRPPVTVSENAWPLIASAQDSEHDGQVECQANRKSRWWIGVRQHDDGRAIVYATYSYTSTWQNSRDFVAKAGILLPAKADAEAICAAIQNVGNEIAGMECSEGDADRWPTLVAECIADMPAEELE